MAKPTIKDKLKKTVKALGKIADAAVKKAKKAKKKTKINTSVFANDEVTHARAEASYNLQSKSRNVNYGPYAAGSVTKVKGWDTQKSLDSYGVKANWNPKGNRNLDVYGRVGKGAKDWMGDRPTEGKVGFEYRFKDGGYVRSPKRK